ncbi:MAG: DNA-3-methyladenine glycosylase [Planctomycetota bacterium]
MPKLNSGFQSGVAELRRLDPVLGAVIQRAGVCRLTRQKSGYGVLVQSVISQQISTAAAKTIRGRLEGLLPGGRIQAEAVNGVTDEQLRGIGISRQKAAYIRDLTRCTLDGVIQFRRIARASDEEAIAELVQVKGIGRWTAQMYLIFSLGRPDVFAVDDLGLRNAITRLYGISAGAKRREFELVAERWRPWRSVASWYLWRSLEF